MEKGYVISVVVPVYNEEKYLRKCLDSVCVHSCKKIQVVIVDDGSNDGSEKICDEYSAKYEDVLVFHQKNCGLVAARKTGVDISEGKYIAFVDSDDWIDEDFFLKSLDFLKDGNIDIVAFGCIKEFEDYSVGWGNAVKSGFYRGRELDRIKENAIFKKDELVPWGILPNLWAKIIDKKLISKYIYNVSNQITYGEDAACFYPCLWNSNTLFVVEENPYHYLQNASSMSNRFEKIDYHIIEEIIDCLYKSQYMNTNIANQIELYKFYLYFLRNYNYFDRYGMTLFPFRKISKGDKIVIYGAGGFGRSIIDYIKNNNCVTLQAVVDQKGNCCSTEDYEVYDVKKLLEIDFDFLIIAILNESISKSVYNKLLELGVSSDKILIIDLECLVNI